MDLPTSLAIESWILYGLGVAVVVCRLLSRRIKLGKWRDLMIDDYLMVFALVNFTGVVVSINEVAKNGSNYMPPEEAAELTPEGVRSAIYGSIMTFVLEIFTITATWTVKACLLILYARLTRNTLTKQHMLVKIASGYCVITYLLVIFMFVFYWCNPTYEYWAVPVRIMQCATYYHHMIFTTACNISSDLLLLFIPIPIIIKTRLPTKRKIILCCILGLGVFNILAAILNRYYNFSTPNSYVFLFWYVAEVGIAMMVGNLPLCWPILRTVLGGTEHSRTPSYHGETISGAGRKKRRLNPLGSVGSTAMGTAWDKLEDRDYGGPAGEATQTQQTGSDEGSQIELVLQGHNLNHHHHAAVSSNGTGVAQEQQLHPAGTAGSSSGSSHNSPSGGDKIMVVTTVDVSSESHR
ncbi:hypothetical protein TOPH_02762 [Tolypocladium ophioglossoides CBS 100239]|uniref:Rhodopsin domain-containing protein n=1 Tax=Tolypocladium ophioglossoides (strain CBS 100239) TaxID=1163406 RepID=A0A0L0NG46_TOLOC|nr:hypothetical protein TOPH_02762 [Tolypocladium ophioglossoides CBS 100239]